MNKFEKHMAKGAKLELKNEDGTTDIFDLKPLEYEDMDKYYLLLETITEMENKLKADKKDMTDATTLDIFKYLGIDAINLIRELCLKTVILSYPDLDKTMAKNFTKDNFMNIFPLLFEANAI
jgi:hypothetical protein